MRAQKAEAADRQKTLASVLKWTDKERREVLEYICKLASLSEDELKHMRILEIGGIEVECAFDSDITPPKLVLDPLLPWPRSLNQQGKPCYRIKAMGEHIPLRDNQIDMCYCMNTIDHTLSPMAVLQEIRRVLVAHGILIISCMVFPAWTRPFFPLFNILDRPHPHHFTLKQFRNLVKRDFRIQKEFEPQRNYRLSHIKNLKNNMAALLGVKYAIFRCTPTMKASKITLE